MLTPIFEVETNTLFTYDLAITQFNNTNATTLGSDDTVAVFVSTDCGVTWSPVVVYDSASVVSNTGQNDTVYLSAYVGQNIQVGFYASEGIVDDPEDNDIFIDNIIFRHWLISMLLRLNLSHQAVDVVQTLLRSLLFFPT